ncbi:uncharacterized protein F5Z01DRAFT_456477 [Emericellopsis atlantica]|uniref:Transmembrane protein n=1 Tax=Emericellopsis atlantica TaxID=2614577 RepID=A0A9P7ZRT6_9HYPO|nr:uncharacterized protein F5Z01DRAFT_456477 [Emericellopsis atlantica]KAG9257168.1 hypothetical protein F5Z01DRAFT_456477 [Emericellopsis atlantica]
MNNIIQAAPVHYPTSSVSGSSLEVFRTHRNFSLNSDHSHPPAYDEERAPPRYVDPLTEAALEGDREGDRRKKRKALKVRYAKIAGSALIVVLVTLLIAGVVSKFKTVRQRLGEDDTKDNGRDEKKLPTMTATMSMSTETSSPTETAVLTDPLEPWDSYRGPKGALDTLKEILNRPMQRWMDEDELMDFGERCPLDVRRKGPGFDSVASAKRREPMEALSCLSSRGSENGFKSPLTELASRNSNDVRRNIEPKG